MLEDLLNIFREVSAGMVSDAQVTRGAKWIEAMQREFPLAAVVLDGLLYKTPEQVLESLARFNPVASSFKDNAAALEYIGELQKRLRGKQQP